MIRLTALSLLVVALAAGAADIPPVTIQTPAGEIVLQPIPTPDLSGMEAGAQETLESARKSLQAIAARADAPPADLATAYGEMGELYHAYHVYLPADPCYANAAALMPGELRWPYYRGYLAKQTTRLEDARAALLRAVQLAPGDPATRMRLALVYLDLNQVEEAEPLLRALQEDPPMRAAALHGLGRAALARQDYQRAAQLMEEALALQPQALRIHYTLAMAYRGQGVVDRARQHLAAYGDGEPAFPDPLVERLEGLASGVRTQLFRAITAVHEGQHEKAAQVFRVALEMDPDNVNARVSLARSLYLSGDREGSIQELQEALRRDPRHDLANFLMGVLQEAQGRDAEAARHLEATLAVDPVHPGAHQYLGNLLLRAGRPAEAAEHYARVTQDLPENLVARLLYAASLIRQGGRDLEARRVLEEAVALHPDQPMFRFVLARLLAASPTDAARDGSRALELAQALQAEMSFPPTIETLAMAYAELGRFTEAVAAQENALAQAYAFGALPVAARMEEVLRGYREARPARSPFAQDEPLLQPPPTDPALPMREYPTRAAY